ncbi:glycosyltransferase family 2 protein [Actinotalea subterranea]|uniref:glycosyltransferase family 2 protein n=1 Tax=Actinotalea subterranea TaxID=2607497 RepID=UPI0011EFD822|nr:glycosyltransferase family 2 protein [Actinotalea subterranea]
MSTRRTPTVAAVLIVKDEEAVLAQCLASVQWADEVVVYDTGSTDTTRDVARQFTDRVVEGYWDDDFGAARNRALEHVTADWVLSIDADEVFEGVPAQLRKNLGRDGATAHSVIQHNVDEAATLPLAPPTRSVSARVSVHRVFRRDVHVWTGSLHEQLTRRVDAPVPAHLVPLPDVVLRHTGYATEVRQGKAKGERNVALAEAEIEAGRRAGVPAEELESSRIQLARSLAAAGRFVEAAALGEELRSAGLSLPRRARLLATSMVGVTHLLGDAEATDRWLDLWEQSDDNPAFARAARARVAAERGQADVALAALEAMPTTTLNGEGERLDRISYVRIEVWALATLGRGRQATQVAVAAARKGVAPGAPGGLVSLLGRERTTRVIEVLGDALWREYVTACLMEPDADARTFLRWMHDARPGDPTVLGAVATAALAFPLEEAAAWAIELRRYGAAEQCPLVRIALDERVDARGRALAGALAFSVYGDERALAGLEAALALVPAAEEAALLAELDVLAPGLVTPAADG